jgi:hypothetical protein
MARIEYMRLRLNNWALWKVREASGGLGWSTQSVLLSEPASGYRESVIPIDDVDAEVTNTAVEALRPDRQHLYDTLQCVYPQGQSLKAAAAALGVGASTISARLDQADMALMLWFRDRREAAKSKRSSAT